MPQNVTEIMVGIGVYPSHVQQQVGISKIKITCKKNSNANLISFIHILAFGSNLKSDTMATMVAVSQKFNCYSTLSKYLLYP